MPDQVKVPGVGEVDRRWVAAGAVVVGGIWLYVWWRRRQSSSSTAQDPNAIDPATGLPYSAETGAGAGGAYVNPVPGASGSNSVSDSNAAISTNAQWTQAVSDTFASMALYDGSFTATTLGKYLAKQPLTMEEATLVRTAWAYEGKPPQGPDNFTLVTTSPAPGTPSGIIYITRKEQPTNSDAIAYKVTETSWGAVLANHYTLPSTLTGNQRGTIAYNLAHANNDGGGTNPKGKTVRLPLILSLST